MRDAVEHIQREIDNLRAIITELRPAALDELGLRTAIEALIERHREVGALAITAELSLPGPASGETRLDPDLESSAYRLVQEALSNIAKHAQASNVRISMSESGGELLVELEDDGVGFDTGASSQGFGLAGMRERVELAGGSLNITSGPQGTVVSVRLPVRDAPQEQQAGSAA
jgi:signal transduction histidine kinase